MPYRLGLLGLGTVGTGAVKTLLTNQAQIAQRAGCELKLAGVADLDLESERGVDLSAIRTTTDGWELIRDPEIDGIIELIGGEGIAKEFVKGALEAGKDVITANKALLAAHGSELFHLAKEKGRKIYFEGAVGGGIPLIQSFYGGLAAARITEIHAIINGTSNYILTAMEDSGRPFHVILKEAQELGYAELDPTYDVDGVDAAHKITLLASIAFGTEVKLENVFTEGIRDITIEDIRFGEQLGYKLKLLAIAKDLGSEIEVRVHPTFVPAQQLLASVRGVFNAVNTYADGLGSTMLCGRGAGDLPTGHAVISDAIQAAMDAAARQAIDYTSFFTARKSLRPMSEVETACYLRLIVKDQPGVLAQIAGIMGENNISILSMLQTEMSKNGTCPLVFMTHEAKEGHVMQALQQIKALPVVVAEPKVIRIEPMHRHRQKD